MKSTVLTKEEREILVLAGQHPNDRHLSNSEIAQHLSMPVHKVKAIIHRACVKLGAHNRTEAVFLAVKLGEIKLSELYSPDEIAKYLNLIDPDILIRIALLMRQEPAHRQSNEEDEKIISTNQRQATVLTNSERSVLILTARGLTNREIADSLYITISSVRTFLYRAYAKLGARNRADAVVLALKRSEINTGQILSVNEHVQILEPVGADLPPVKISFVKS